MRRAPAVCVSLGLGGAIGAVEAGWDPAWGATLRLADAACTVAIAPGPGRIVGFAARDGGEVLWTDPRCQAGAAAPAGGAAPAGVATGGDKVWIWPQADWAARYGAEWPPAFEADAQPYRAEVVGPGRVRLVSRVIPAYGFRIEREIALGPEPGTLTVVNAFVQEAPWSGAPVAVWAVSQVRRPERLYARAAAASVQAMQGAWPPPAPGPGGLLAFALPVGQSKIGLAADLLAADLGGRLLLQWMPDGTDGQRPDRAQLFRSHGRADYVELEWTSPRRALAVGERLELRLRWALVPGLGALPAPPG